MSVKYFGGGGYNPPAEVPPTAYRNAELSDHDRDTTSVHGITDTAALLTTGKIRGKRTNATVGASTSLVVAVTWDTAFPDTNYTVVCSVIDTSGTAGEIRTDKIFNKTATGFSVVVVNAALASKTCVVQSIGIAD